MPKNIRIDLTGQVFGRLTVLNYEYTNRGAAYWKCVCSCGDETVVNSYKLRSGRTRSCGCLMKEHTMTMTKLETGIAAFKELISNYKTKAHDRGLVYSLTDEEALELFKGNCFYCGLSPNQHYRPNRNGGFIYNGIDRVNNEIGYSKDNCVPCCKHCNRAKMDRSLDEFLEWVDRVYSTIHNK